METTFLGLLFLVPLAWLLGTLSTVHLAALAGTAAAREVGFEVARSLDEPSAQSTGDDIAAQSFRNHGLAPERADVSISMPSGLDRGEPIEIVVRYPVSVLQVPLLDSIVDASITVEARHTARVDPYRSRT